MGTGYGALQSPQNIALLEWLNQESGPRDLKRNLECLSSEDSLDEESDRRVQVMAGDLQ